jgi:hypothetical protein
MFTPKIQTIKPGDAIELHFSSGLKMLRGCREAAQSMCNGIDNSCADENKKLAS